MSTLKIRTVYDNVIWLMGVSRVETLCHAYTKNPDRPDSHLYPDETDAWQALLREVRSLNDPYLKQRIQNSICDHKNFSTAVENGVKPPTHMILTQVHYLNGNVENWLLEPENNYLMFDGQTIDRI